MRKMTQEDVLLDLQEVVFSLVRKVQAVSGMSRKEALEIVASASKALTDDLAGRANGTSPDQE